jgi:hypothetical protein
VRPYPVIIIRYPGPKEHLVVKAEPPPGSRYILKKFTYHSHHTLTLSFPLSFIVHLSFSLVHLSSFVHIAISCFRFTIENHMAFFKAKDQTFIEHRQVSVLFLLDAPFFV